MLQVLWEAEQVLLEVIHLLLIHHESQVLQAIAPAELLDVADIDVVERQLLYGRILDSFEGSQFPVRCRAHRQLLQAGHVVESCEVLQGAVLNGQCMKVVHAKLGQIS